MDLILTDYDISGGDVRSAVIEGATQFEFQSYPTLLTGDLEFRLEKRMTGGQWIPVRDDRNMKVTINTKSNIADGFNIVSLSGACDISVYVVTSKEGATVKNTGTLSIGVETDGTLAV